MKDMENLAPKAQKETKERSFCFFLWLKKYIPIPALVFFCFGLVAAIVHLIACLSPAFAEWVNNGLGAGLRFFLAKLTDPFPFSIGESLLYCLPLLVLLIVVFGIRRAKQSGTAFVRFLCAPLALVVFLYSTFVFTIGCGYRGKTLDEKLSLDARAVSVSELYSTAEILRDKTNALAVHLTQEAGGASVMPYTYREMNEKLLDAYETVSEKYPFIQRMRTRVKAVAASEWMSYTHITGVYTYMTGEANINNVFPDYTIPFTAAHELAHQRGIARENEANFVAFLVCISSEDDYLRYSGYMNMLEYVTSALYSVDPNGYYKLAEGYAVSILYERRAYREFYEKYKDSVVGEISGSINDAYLQIQGTPGTRSYGMVVDLAVAYYRDLPAE